MRPHIERPESFLSDLIQYTVGSSLGLLRLLGALSADRSMCTIRSGSYDSQDHQDGQDL